MSGRLGITIPLPGVPLADHQDWLRRLVDLGFSDCWTMETTGFDAFTPLALAAAWAPELRLGTAIASVFSRGPALLAQTAAGVADAAPGRFVLGLGSSSETMSQSWNDVVFERPYARVRDSLHFLRRAMEGERIDTDYESFSCHGFQLDRAPAQPPPIYLAALRRDMLRLAARQADGVLLSLVGAADLEPIRAVLSEAAPDRASSTPERDIVLRLGVMPIADAERCRDLGRRTLAAYLSVPAYAQMMEWLGHAELLAPMVHAWQSGDRRAAVAAVPDALVDALFVHGSAPACREQLQAFQAAGVSTPVVSLMNLGPGAYDVARVLEEMAGAGPGR